MWVKICGTTNREDALMSVEAGADALGFIFAESPRRVTVEQARDIAGTLPKAVEKIGVFVNACLPDIEAAVAAAGLTGVQLHGDERASMMQQIGRAGVTVIKAMSAAQLENIADVSGALAGEGAAAVALPRGMHALLIDSGTEARRGGTGVAFAWQETREVVRWMSANVHIIVAGGLTPANVREAIRILEPWGVDVVSGVESAPGKKDPAKVRAFVKAAKQGIAPRLAR
jgi:phosphoribosylanthranilate isomerase